MATWQEAEDINRQVYEETIRNVPKHIRIAPYRPLPYYSGGTPLKSNVVKQKTKYMSNKRIVIFFWITSAILLTILYNLLM